MKKVSLKNEIGGMLEDARVSGHYIGHRQRPMTIYEMKSGNFRASFDMLTGDQEGRRWAEDYIRKRAAAVDRGTVVSRAQLDRRSNNFQKAMAYIGEHRHLIPFFRFVDEYLHENPKKSETDAVREWKKKHKSLPAEVTFESWGYGSQGSYTIGDKHPDIATVAAQIPYLPKAWML